MYDYIDGVLSISGGIYVYLILVGKLELVNVNGKMKNLFDKNKTILKIMSILLIFYGITKLSDAYFDLNIFL